PRQRRPLAGPTVNSSRGRSGRDERRARDIPRSSRTEAQAGTVRRARVRPRWRLLSEDYDALRLRRADYVAAAEAVGHTVLADRLVPKVASVLARQALLF